MSEQSLQQSGSAKRPRGVAGALLLVALGAGLLAGCTDDSLLPAAPAGVLRYPIALQADPSGKYVYVAGANFNRQFRAGEIRILDTENEVWLRDRQEIPSFCGELTLYPGEAGASTRLLATARDDDSLTSVAVEADAQGKPSLSCGKLTSTGRCAADHRAGADEDKTVGDDPMGVDVAELDADHLRITTVGTSDGRVIVRQVNKADTTLKGSVIGSFDFGSGLHSVVTSPLTGWTYISDLRSSNLYAFTVDRTGAIDSTTGLAAWQVTNQGVLTLPSNGNSDHGRGMALSSDKGRLYIAWRSPAALAVLDIAPGPTGPRNQLIDLIGLGNRPSTVAVAPTGPNGRDLVYVSNFGDDRIWVVDPDTREIRDLIAVPGSPYSIAVANVPGKGWTLYAGLFTSSAVAVVPLEVPLPSAAVRLVTDATEAAP